MVANEVHERIARLSAVKRQLLEQRLRAELPQAPSARMVERIPPGLPAPLTHTQRAIWFTQAVNPDEPLYNQARVYRLYGPVEASILAEALRLLVLRHAVLRTTVMVKEGVPLQQVQPDLHVALSQADLEAAADPQALLGELLEAEVRKPFDVEKDAPLRALLVRLAADEHVLLFVHHFVAFDHWSISIFNRELSSIYNALMAGRRPGLAPLPIDYASFAAWQAGDESAQHIAAHTGYWRWTLAKEPPALELPTDRSPRAAASLASDSVDLELPPAAVEQLNELARRENATLFMVLMAGLQTLLSRYTQQDDIAVGTLIANRRPVETEALLGNFSNLLVMRSSLAGNPSFRQFVRRVRGVTLGAYTHQDVPLGRIIEELRPARGSQRPFFQVLFDYLNTPTDRLRFDGIKAEQLPFAPLAAEYPLQVAAVRAGTRLHLRLQYQTGVFARSAVERMAGHLQTLLLAAAEDPEQPVGSLPLLTGEERSRLLHAWNDTAAAEHDLRSLIAHFEEQVALHPRAVAFASDSTSLTYAELNARANRLAHYLQENGVRPGVRVGLCLERSLTAVVAILAIFKAGGIYIPLDPGYPEERLRYIADDSHVQVILTVRRWQQQLRFGSAQVRMPVRVLCLDELTGHLQHMPAHNLKQRIDPGQVAYVIYTSGSTGAPKGVEVPHRQILNRLRWMWEAYPFSANDIGSMKMALSFVDSLWETFGYLLQGVPTIVLADEVVRDPEALVEALANHGVTRLWLVPSQLRMILQLAPDLRERLPRLRFWVATGEPLPVDLAREFAAAAPDAVLYNLYGTSEVWDVTWYDPTQEEAPAYSSLVPIGRPIRNMQTLVLDRNLQLVPVGVTGELFVGGVGLGKGYYNRPELTAERFITHPLAGAGGRLYRTGDQARVLPDGNIEFLGRIDHQVKLRGFRIELGEIEALLRELPEVRDAVVVLRGDAGNQQLVAYLTPNGTQRIAAATLRDTLTRRLPAYMVPATFLWIDQMPYTPSGKVDRKALPEPGQAEVGAASPYVAPRNRDEERMAALWAEVLGVQQVGIHDDFFALGGHSLLGVRLFVRIEEEFHQRLPVTLLFQYSTVAELTAQLRASGSVPEVRSSWATLIPIQPEGNRPPFFCVHGFGGGVVGYATLAQLLGSDQPFYGLQARGLDGREAPDTTIPAMAARYIAAMRQVQPVGPYRIGGYCLGGEVAFEMARQLEAAGERAVFVAIIEGFAPTHGQGADQYSASRSERWMTIARSVPYWWNDYLRLGAAEVGGRVRRSAVSVYRGTFRKLGVQMEEQIQEYLPHDIALLPRHQRHLMETQLGASHNYAPGRYGGRITLFRADRLTINRALFGSLDQEHGWGKLCAGVDTVTVEGGHQDLYLPPHVHSLAAAMRQCLDAVLDA